MKERTFGIIYILGLIFSTLFMIWILLLGILNFAFLFFYWIFKFLSGFGLIFTITSIFLVILKKSENKISKRGVTLIIFLNIIVIALLIIYALYQLISTVYNVGIERQEEIMLWFDSIIFISGIITFLLFFYIVPIVRERFHEAVILNKFKRFTKGAKKSGREIKKKYFIFRRKYAKAQIQGQKTIQKHLEFWQRKLTMYMLLPLVVGTIIFTPIAFICFMFWLKIYGFDDLEIKTYEKIAFLISMIIICIIASLMPILGFELYYSFSEYFWTIHIFYLVGITSASLIFIIKFLNLK